MNDKQKTASSGPINAMAKRKKISTMNGDNLPMLKDLVRTETGPTIFYRNKFQRDKCAKQVTIWQKDIDMKCRNIRRSSNIFKDNLKTLQSEKDRIKRERGLETSADNKIRLKNEETVNTGERNVLEMIKAFMKEKSEIVEDEAVEEQTPKAVPIDRRNEMRLINFM